MIDSTSAQLICGPHNVVSINAVFTADIMIGVEQELVGRKGNLGETSNSVENCFLPFQFLFNPYILSIHKSHICIPALLKSHKCIPGAQYVVSHIISAFYLPLQCKA